MGAIYDPDYQKDMSAVICKEDIDHVTPVDQDRNHARLKIFKNMIYVMRCCDCRQYGRLRTRRYLHARIK